MLNTPTKLGEKGAEALGLAIKNCSLKHTILFARVDLDFELPMPYSPLHSFLWVFLEICSVLFFLEVFSLSRVDHEVETKRVFSWPRVLTVWCLNALSIANKITWRKNRYYSHIFEKTVRNMGKLIFLVLSASDVLLVNAGVTRK